MDGVLLRKCVVEFIGTFFLVFVIGCVSSQAHVLLAPLAIGATLMVMIFAGGHISGAHYNPAVTLGVWISGACNGLEAAFYMVAQLIGAVAASIAVPILFGHTITAIATGSPLQVVLAEFLGTFALVYTVLCRDGSGDCWKFLLRARDWLHCFRASCRRRFGFRRRI
jgi:aquaporin Z